mmetsp:Transcript_22432/g.66802  ORF Transcript_22432/g.66802 Transcript_22432/m.66802 type:complete len:240 (+) Transcript_22432:1313-2032(+)
MAGACGRRVQATLWGCARTAPRVSGACAGPGGRRSGEHGRRARRGCRCVEGFGKWRGGHRADAGWCRRGKRCAHACCCGQRTGTGGGAATNWDAWWPAASGRGGTRWWVDHATASSFCGVNGWLCNLTGGLAGGTAPGRRSARCFARQQRGRWRCQPHAVVAWPANLHAVVPVAAQCVARQRQPQRTCHATCHLQWRASCGAGSNAGWPEAAGSRGAKRGEQGGPNAHWLGQPLCAARQ